MSDLELLLQPRPGVSLVLATVPQPALRPAQVEAASVDIYLGYADDDFGKAQLLGSVRPGGTLTVEYNPDRDRDLRIYKIARAEDGAPDCGQMRDAESIVVPINRMVDTPTIVQPANATHTVVNLAVPANRHAKTIRFRVSANSDMSGYVETEVDAGNDMQGTVFQITRGTLGSGAQTRYVTVAFSAGSGYGPESAITTIAFADIGGSGGSGGSPLPPGALQPVTVS